MADSIEEGLDDGTYTYAVGEGPNFPYAPEEGVDSQGPWAKICYWVPQADRGNFADQMLLTGAQTGGVAGAWTSTAPYSHPVFPAMTAQDVRFKVAGKITLTGDHRFPIFDKVLATVMFRPPRFNYDPNQIINNIDLTQDSEELEALRLANVKISWGSEIVTVPGSAMVYPGDIPVNIPTRRRVTVKQIFITWFKFPFIPFGKAKEFADTVNDSTFLGCEPNTVLYLGIDTDRDFFQDGTAAQQVRMAFKWRKESWNKVPNPAGSGWIEITDKVTADTLYEEKDFKQLLLKANKRGRWA